MSNYSIKDLEHLSGIKAHTLRIWEQRYNFIKPKRTKTNIRYYDDHDLKLILNVSFLKDNGIKISKIAKLSLKEMQNEILRITERSMHHPDQIHYLTMSMIDLDEDRFEKVIANNILHLGFENTMLNIVYPFLKKIGILWQTGTINPAQEHFIANLVRQKLIVAIDGLHVSSRGQVQKFLLFLPEGELHELTLLFSYYLIKSRQNKVIYLGQSVPFSDVKDVYAAHNPDVLLTVITSEPNKDHVLPYITKLSKEFPKSRIILSGSQVLTKDFSNFSNVEILEEIPELEEYLEETKKIIHQ